MNKNTGISLCLALLLLACSQTNNYSTNKTSQTNNKVENQSESKGNEVDLSKMKTNLAGCVIDEKTFMEIDPGVSIVPELQKTFGDKLQKATLQTGEGDFPYWSLKDDVGKEIARLFELENQIISIVEVVSPKCKTIDGIGVGSTLEDLKRVYPDWEIHGSEIEGLTTLTSSSTPLGFILSVRFWSYVIQDEDLLDLNEKEVTVETVLLRGMK